jgi:hypothetical protein
LGIAAGLVDVDWGAETELINIKEGYMGGGDGPGILDSRAAVEAIIEKES